MSTGRRGSLATMSTEIVPTTSTELATELRANLEAAADFAKKSRSQRTIDAYAEDWRQFEAWCAERGYTALPATPETLIAWLGYIGKTKAKPSTIARKLAAISMQHRQAGLDSPRDVRAVREVLKGIRRDKGVRPKKAKPLMGADLHLVIAGMKGNDLHMIRNRALVLVGWICALRRSELVALVIENLEFLGKNARFLLGATKTDQEGQGEYVAVFAGKTADVCPVAALKLWLERSGITSGPIFRGIDHKQRLSNRGMHPENVCKIIKKYVGEKFSPHSLRSGFATTAGAEKRSLPSIMQQTRHKSVQVAMGYIRPETIMQGNAAEDLL